MIITILLLPLGHISFKFVESCAVRETSASLDFFDCLVLRVTGTFLTEALVAFGDFTAGSVSCIEGSSTATSSVEGAVGASLFSSSSSLKAKGKQGFYNPRGRKKVQRNHRTQRKLTMPSSRKARHLLLE
jgi:hypothetical protein